MFKAIVYQAEGTGCGAMFGEGMEHVYITGKGVAMSKSPKVALATAYRRSNDMLRKSGKEVGLLNGAIPVDGEVKLYKDGKLIIDDW